MQQFSVEHFCEECGAANQEGASRCVACQRPLVGISAPVTSSLPPILPVNRGLTAVQLTAFLPGISALQKGMLLNERYQISGILGQGGFGSVYKARDLRARGRVVAIKEIDLSMLQTREIIVATDSFNREVSMLSTLEHRNLPKVFAFFTDANHWYLVLQYIKGQTLEEYLQRSRRGYLSPGKVMHIGQALIDVLSYLHSRQPPIIFRDLKPANIMLTRTGRVYLIDFGIARRFSPEKKRDTGPLGSPAYAAPEQYGGSQTDARTDIYGLGATLQTLFTGRDPLELAQGQPPRRKKPVPEKLHALLTSMLEADPARRPRDMSVVEERFSLESRHMLGPRAFLKGMLIGLGFLAWYIFLGVGISILTAPKNQPFFPSNYMWFMVLLNAFPVAVFVMTVYQLVALFFVRRRWLAVGVLLMLVVTLAVALTGVFPGLFAWAARPQ